MPGKFRKSMRTSSWLGATQDGGLSNAVAMARLKAEGMNALAASRPRNFVSIVLGVMQEPMFLLLAAAALIYMLLGDVADALMLLGFVCMVLAITIYQENKTERVLDALRDLSSPRALVIRDGVEQRIAGREVVRGDLLLLAEGDRVPADALLLYCSHFAADESLLTGESVAMHKRALHDSAISQQTLTTEVAPPGGDGLPFVYSGSLVVQGRAAAQVLATGPNSMIGKIGKTLQALDTQTTPLQQEIKRLVHKLAIVGVLLCLLLLLYGVGHGHWLHRLLSGITLAMSIFPEEYPLVLTVFMAMGAWRISKYQVLTRRANTVVALVSATVMCVDKTGTLTFNRMQVEQLVVNNDVFVTTSADMPMPETFHELAEFAILASESAPFDPMGKAILALGKTI